MIGELCHPLTSSALDIHVFLQHHLLPGMSIFNSASQFSWAGVRPVLPRGQ